MDWPLGISAGSTLALSGCGFGEIEIPLSASTLPNATAQEAVDVTLHTITWTADPSTQSALVHMNTSLTAEDCHDLGAVASSNHVL